MLIFFLKLKCINKENIKCPIMQDKLRMADKTPEERPVYLSIDHLNDGTYVFNIMLKNKVVKSFKLKK